MNYDDIRNSYIEIISIISIMSNGLLDIYIYYYYYYYYYYSTIF